MDQTIIPEQIPTKPRYTIWLIIGVIIAVCAVAALAYYLYNQKISVDKTDKTSENNSGSNITWRDYSNSRFGFKTEIPSNLEEFPSDSLERVSFSENSESSDNSGAEGYQKAITFAEIWYENSTQLPKDAIESEKANVQQFAIKNFTVLSDENITIDGQAGVKSVWSYSDLQTGAFTISGHAYTSKSGKLWKITFLASGSNQTEVEKIWQDYSYIFDKMISAFIFM